MAKHHSKKHTSKKHTSKNHTSKKQTSKKAGSGKWIEHVKQYAKDNNMKFGEALKEAAKTYKK